MEKLKYYMKEIAIFIVIVTVLSNVISFYKSSGLNKNSLNNIESTLVNKYFKSSNEKPLLIHFWATWCPTCKLEASNIEYISQNYNVITVAVKSDNITKYMKENNLTFKVIEDKDSMISQKFNISAYPTTFIYDKNKNLIFSEVGYTSSFGLWIRMFISSL